MDWLNSNVLVAVVSAMLTGGLTMLGGYIQLKRMGINEGNVAEVTDRAALRAFTMEQLKHLTQRIDECEEDRARLHAENLRLERRVMELERTVNGKD